METTWEIVGEDGQFLVVDYTNDGRVIRLQVLPPERPAPDSEKTFDQLLVERIIAHAPSLAQFEGVPPPADLELPEGALDDAGAVDALSRAVPEFVLALRARNDGDR